MTSNRKNSEIGDGGKEEKREQGNAKFISRDEQMQ